MKYILSFLLALSALTANAALDPTKYTEYPNTNHVQDIDLVLLAVTNQVPATNKNIKYVDLRTQLSNEIAVVIINTNSAIYVTNNIGGEGLWTNQSFGVVRLINGSTNSPLVDTNSTRGLFIGDTNRGVSYFAWPANGLTYLSVLDGSPGHTLNRWQHGVMDSNTNGAFSSILTLSGSSPIYGQSFANITNGVIASEIDFQLQKTGGYLLLRDNANDSFVGLQNGGQLSSDIGGNQIRAQWGGVDTLLLATNGAFVTFGNVTNYGNTILRSNLTVLRVALFNDTASFADSVVMFDSLVVLKGVFSTGFTNTLGMRSTGPIQLGDAGAIATTTSSNVFRVYGPTYMQNASLTAGQMLYLDGTGLVSTQPIPSGGSGSAPEWTNDVTVYRTVGGSTNFVGGGVSNNIASGNTFSTISGGASNLITASVPGGVIGGGTFNVLGGINSVLAGGVGNTVAGNYGVIGGGIGNALNNSGTVIGGGSANLGGIAAQYTVVAGGHDNTSYSSNSVISGGVFNTIYGGSDSEVIAGGSGNTIVSAHWATVGGGASNTINTGQIAATIAGGKQNLINGSASQLSAYSFIGGGFSNTVDISTPFAAIASGEQNTLQATHGFIGSGYLNTIQSNATHSTISGGNNNLIGNSSIYATIAGGLNNTIQRSANGGAIGGGNGNTIQQNSQQATIIGGANNLIGSNSIYSVILGGGGNTISSNTPYAFVIGNGQTFSNANAFTASFTNTAKAIIDSSAIRMVGMGTLYHSNNVAVSALPTAAQIGAGGFWIGNSNGAAVKLSSANGTTTAMYVFP